MSGDPSLLEQLFSEEKFVSDYRKWLRNPITNKVLECAEEISRPKSLASADPNEALYMHGVFVGFNRMLDFLRGAEAAAKVADISEAEADYGAGRIHSKLFPKTLSGTENQ